MPKTVPNRPISSQTLIFSPKTAFQNPNFVPKPSHSRPKPSHSVPFDFPQGRPIRPTRPPCDPFPPHNLSEASRPAGAESATIRSRRQQFVGRSSPRPPRVPAWRATPSSLTHSPPHAFPPNPPPQSAYGPVASAPADSSPGQSPAPNPGRRCPPEEAARRRRGSSAGIASHRSRQ